MSLTPAAPGSPPPSLGLHTGHVLAEVLGFGEESIETLRRDGVILG